MKVTVCRHGAAAIAAALFVFLGTPAAHAQAPVDSLTLQAPAEVKAWSVYIPQSKRFQVWLTWRDHPDSVSTFITPADTTGWSLITPADSVSFPTVTGEYNGSIDRTLSFQATREGQVGVDNLIVTYFIRREENINGSVTLAPGYVPGTPIPMAFRDESNNNAPVNLGLQIAFSAGRIDDEGTFIVGLEDFEGFHIWRGTERDGSDLQIIGELSKEEAFKGEAPGGSLVDSVYFYDVVPTLRASGVWISPFGPPPGGACIGTRIALDLPSDGYFWFDCNAANGFTYYYAVTSFDRGYSPQQGGQGLSKFDNCTVTKGTPYVCEQDLTRLVIEVDAQSDLYNVYVVPNPVRTGSSRLTTDNYHGFPDGMCRFVNLPSACTIKIFTVSGQLVWMNEHSDGSGNVEWDTRNLEDQEVASGVYIYRIERHATGDVDEANTQDSVFGRIVVIR